MEGSMRTLLTLAAAMICCRAVLASVIYVPSDQVTIQAGIDAAAIGDTVVVADGHYFERVNFTGKNITVASNYLLDGDTLHLYQTILDGDTTVLPLDSVGAVVRFVGFEDATALLSGLTIRGGVDFGAAGGGVSCQQATPTISHCRIVGNSPHGIRGGAVEAGVKQTIESCVIAENLGRGVASSEGAITTLINCSLLGNTGAGISGHATSFISIYGGMISGNTGAACEVYRFDVIRDCLVENNGGGIGALTNLPKRVIGKRADEGPYLLSNLIVRNNGVGISVLDHSFRIDSCLIENNVTCGISIWTDGLANVANSVLRGNGGPSSIGGGIHIGGSTSLGLNCTNTLFDNNTAQMGGAIAQIRNSAMSIGNCTFFNNSADSGAAIFQDYFVFQSAQVENSNFAFNQGGVPVLRAASPDVMNWPDSLLMEFSCSNIFGNSGGNWVGDIAGYHGINGNISADPIFCGPAFGNFELSSTSLCVPEHNDCGVLMGAFAEGCALGDPDGNSIVTLSDAIFIINYIFANGVAPEPVESGDADCNGMVTISDVVYLINFIFAGGPAPC